MKTQVEVQGEVYVQVAILNLGIWPLGLLPRYFIVICLPAWIIILRFLDRVIIRQSYDTTVLGSDGTLWESRTESL